MDSTVWRIFFFRLSAACPQTDEDENEKKSWNDRETEREEKRRKEETSNREKEGKRDEQREKRSVDYFLRVTFNELRLILVVMGKVIFG